MHNQIINTIANQYLNPSGILQVKNSKIWIKDYFWFSIILEFQPSGFSKGTHLNIAADFHFDTRKNFAFIYPSNARVNKFITFSDANTEDFELQIKQLCMKAITVCNKLENEILSNANIFIFKAALSNNPLLWFYLGAYFKICSEKRLSTKFFNKFLSKNQNVEMSIQVELLKSMSESELIDHINSVRLLKHLPITNLSSLAKKLTSFNTLFLRLLL